MQAYRWSGDCLLVMLLVIRSILVSPYALGDGSAVTTNDPELLLRFVLG